MKLSIRWPWKRQSRREIDVVDPVVESDDIVYFLKDRESRLVISAVGYENGKPKAMYSGMLDENTVIFTFRETAKEWAKILNAVVHEAAMQDGELIEL